MDLEGELWNVLFPVTSLVVRRVFEGALAAVPLNEDHQWEVFYSVVLLALLSVVASS